MLSKDLLAYQFDLALRISDHCAIGRSLAVLGSCHRCVARPKPVVAVMVRGRVVVTFPLDRVLRVYDHCAIGRSLAVLGSCYRCVARPKRVAAVEVRGCDGLRSSRK